MRTAGHAAWTGRIAAAALCAAALAACRVRAGEEIWDDRPGAEWESSWYPLGNGRIGCMVDGGTPVFRVQFNVDSLWTGDAISSPCADDSDADANYARMGAYQNFGELTVGADATDADEQKLVPPVGYRRSLDLSRAVYEDSFAAGGWTARRRVFASAPDDAIFIVVEGGLPPVVALKGAHGEETAKGEDGALSFSGVLANGLEYAARADVAHDADAGTSVIVLRAATGMRTIPPLDGMSCESAEEALARHVADYRSLYGRMRLSIADADGRNGGWNALPTRKKLAYLRSGEAKPGMPAPDTALRDLIETQFNFGRYLLISCSRPGTLPANLQGIWNDSNDPPWHCDYHTNVNLQMCYWGADAANLPECFEPLADWMLRTMPAAEAGTRAAFPASRGFAYRTSANAAGGGGWRWNFAGAPWLAAQCHDHWRFVRDDDWLRTTCWPLMKGAAEFMLSTQLKERGDGTVVVRNGWSPEHGPREDGTTHDQQIVRELFRSVLSAAKTLGIDDGFTREVARVEPRLRGDKVGRWGQLQEWEADRDVRGDDHRHTSHLYAVHPGTSISRRETPRLAEAARVALDGRALSGDSRRSWTWPWRAALRARLGDGEKAGEMLRGLLVHNTMDNMFATHPPFQIDGNLGMVAAVCEMLLERAWPASWNGGSVAGLATREGRTESFALDGGGRRQTEGREQWDGR